MARSLGKCSSAVALSLSQEGHPFYGNQYTDAKGADDEIGSAKGEKDSKRFAERATEALKNIGEKGPKVEGFKATSPTMSTHRASGPEAIKAAKSRVDSALKGAGYKKAETSKMMGGSETITSYRHPDMPNHRYTLHAKPKTVFGTKEVTFTLRAETSHLKLSHLSLAWSDEAREAALAARRANMSSVSEGRDAKSVNATSAAYRASRDAEKSREPKHHDDAAKAHDAAADLHDKAGSRKTAREHRSASDRHRKASKMIGDVSRLALSNPEGINQYTKGREFKERNELAERALKRGDMGAYARHRDAAEGEGAERQHRNVNAAAKLSKAAHAASKATGHKEAITDAKLAARAAKARDIDTGIRQGYTQGEEGDTYNAQEAHESAAERHFKESKAEGDDHYKAAVAHAQAAHAWHKATPDARSEGESHKPQLPKGLKLPKEPKTHAVMVDGGFHSSYSSKDKAHEANKQIGGMVRRIPKDLK